MLPLALGACLLVLALPRLVSAVTMLPVEPVLDALQSGRSVGDAELARFAARSAATRHFSYSGAVATDLAGAKLAQADRLPARAQSERRELVEDALELLEEGLAAMPANGFGWASLAYARNLHSGPGIEAVDAWRMSVLTAPAERRLALWRVRFGIAHVSGFLEGDQDLLERQIRFAWRSAPDELARYAISSGPEVVRTIRAALIDQPEDIDKLDSLIP